MSYEVKWMITVAMYLILAIVSLRLIRRAQRAWPAFGWFSERLALRALPTPAGTMLWMYARALFAWVPVGLLIPLVHLTNWVFRLDLPIDSESTWTLMVLWGWFWLLLVAGIILALVSLLPRLSLYRFVVVIGWVLVAMAIVWGFRALPSSPWDKPVPSSHVQLSHEQFCASKIDRLEAAEQNLANAKKDYGHQEEFGSTNDINLADGNLSYAQETLDRYHDYLTDPSRSYLKRGCSLPELTPDLDVDFSDAPCIVVDAKQSEGSQLTYQWQIIASDASDEPFPKRPTTNPVAKHFVDAVGPYFVKLTVNDRFGREAHVTSEEFLIRGDDLRPPLPDCGSDN